MQCPSCGPALAVRHWFPATDCYGLVDNHIRGFHRPIMVQTTAATGSATDLKNVKEAKPQTEDVLISLSSQRGGAAAQRRQTTAKLRHQVTAKRNQTLHLALTIIGTGLLLVALKAKLGRGRAGFLIAY